MQIQDRLTRFAAEMARGDFGEDAGSLANEAGAMAIAAATKIRAIGIELDRVHREWRASSHEVDRLRDALSDLVEVAEMCDDFQHPGRPDCDAYATLEVAKLTLGGEWHPAPDAEPAPQDAEQADAASTETEELEARIYDLRVRAERAEAERDGLKSDFGRIGKHAEWLNERAERAEAERDEALGWIGYYFRSASQVLSGMFTKDEGIKRGRGVVFGLDAAPADAEGGGA